MTMKVVVSNEDAARVAKVVVQDFVIGKAEPVREDLVTIMPGSKSEFWIHSSKRLVVEEQV